MTISVTLEPLGPHESDDEVHQESDRDDQLEDVGDLHDQIQSSQTTKAAMSANTAIVATTISRSSIDHPFDPSAPSSHLEPTSAA